MEQLSNSTSVDTALATKTRSLVPAEWETVVRQIGPSEYTDAGLSLAYSFASDALSRYILDGDDMAGRSDEDKWDIHVRLMKYTAVAFGRNGFVTAIGPDYDAVALWLPPRKQMDGLWTILRSGLWRLHFQLSPVGRKRYYQELLPVLHVTMDKVMEGRLDFYYLGYLGTKPGARGRGYARKLILDIASKADAENLPLYLESSYHKNNAYYKKFGFELKTEIQFNGGESPIALYIMVREPRTVKAGSSSPPATIHVEKASEV